MTYSETTIAQAEASGHTHIEARCRCQCGRTTLIPFRMLLEARQAVQETTLASIANRMRCEQCRARPESWRPWRQYIDGTGGKYGHSQ